jgi:Na+/melibiose symporter-like transporter
VAFVFIVGDRNASLLLVAFLTLYSAYSLFSGLAGLPFMDVVGKAIPADRRGSFFAWRRFTGGLLALGGSALTSYVLDERRGLAFPMNFGWLFAAAALAMGAGFFFFAQVTEPVDAVQDGSPRGMGVGSIRDTLWRDRNYVLFVTARVVLLIHAVAVPFYAVFAREKLGAPTSMAGTYLTVFTLASVGSTLLWGRLGDRRGNRMAMLLGSLLSIPLPLVPLFFGTRISYSAFAVLFLLLGIAQSGTDISALSLALDIAPGAERVLYVGFLNTVLGIVSLLLMGSGLIVQWWGLGALFALSASCAGLSSVLIQAVRDPRADKGRISAFP